MPPKAKAKNSYTKGAKGAYPRSEKKDRRRAVEITRVDDRDDGTTLLDLSGTGPNIGVQKKTGKEGENPNPWTAEGVDAGEFVAEGEVEPEPATATTEPPKTDQPPPTS